MCNATSLMVKRPVWLTINVHRVIRGYFAASVILDIIKLLVDNAILVRLI